jgi:hypothetical protein
VVKQLFVCEPGRSLVALRLITGRLLTGSSSTTETGTWVVAARCSSMSPARRLHSWRSRWEKMAKPIWSGVIISAASANVANSVGAQPAATYRTNQGTYFVFRAGSSAVSAYRITATNPPRIVPAWNVSQPGRGSRWVTTTNRTSNAIVWVVAAGGDQRSYGYNGDTGAVVYAGRGSNELMANTRKWNTGIVARGRIYFAADNKVYAFAVP